jgi:hypothetical protein
MKPHRTTAMNWPMTLTPGAILAAMLVTDVYGADPPRYGHNVPRPPLWWCHVHPNDGGCAFHSRPGERYTCGQRYTPSCPQLPGRETIPRPPTQPGELGI